MNKILVFIPTYDEVDNAPAMCRLIMALPLPIDLHFMDDASPDGTGEALDKLALEFPRVTVSHRAGKLGIGSAHQEGISYAYRNNYDLLVTMDCDFTHDPTKISDLIQALDGYQVVVGSRFLEENSLPGWALHRRFMTLLGHFLTRNLLRLKYDATGAFRLYDLRQISLNLFQAVRSKSYAFFFESLFVLDSNKLRIREIPVVLPSRTYGHSKLSLFEALRSALFLLSLSVERLANPGRFRVGKEVDRLRDDLGDPQGWAPYWQQKKEISGFAYEVVAAFYRNLFIRPMLKKSLFKHFAKRAALMHAGCGSGQADVDLQDQFKITAVDISKEALDLYSRYNPGAFRIEQASILDLPYEKESYDGIYNLGVMEHFTKEDIVKILREFHRVLRRDGKIVIFWPHRYAPSVLFLNSVHWMVRTFTNKKLKLHPDEVSLLTSKKAVKLLFEEAGFDLSSYRMNFKDGFIQAELVGVKLQS